MDLSFVSLLESYGTPALFLATLLQGEAVMVLAGLAARLGHLDLGLVILAGAAGSALGDQITYAIGWEHGGPFIARRPSWQARMDRASRLVHAHRVKVILFFRFLYGIRTVIPFAIGTARVPLRIFAPLNVVAAFLWAAVAGFAGYLFGEALELFFGKLKHVEARLFGALAALFVLVWIARILLRELWRHRAAELHREKVLCGERDDVGDERRGEG